MGTQKVIVDSNVLISAVGWPGKPRQILLLVLMGKIELVMPAKQLEEIRRVVTYPRLKFSASQQESIVALFTRTATIVNTSIHIDAVKRDPDDNIFLETAIQYQVKHIVSGDDHLLSLKSYQSVEIFSAAQFLDIFEYL